MSHALEESASTTGIVEKVKKLEIDVQESSDDEKARLEESEQLAESRRLEE